MSKAPKTALRAALLAGLGSAALAACGGSGDNGVVFSPPEPPPPPTGPAVYGAGFASIFAASPNAQPRDPDRNQDLIPVDKRSDPNDAAAR